MKTKESRQIHPLTFNYIDIPALQTTPFLSHRHTALFDAASVVAREILQISDEIWNICHPNI